MDLAGRADRLLRGIGRSALRRQVARSATVGFVPLLVVVLVLPGWVLQYGCPPSSDRGSIEFNSCFNTLQIPFTMVELGIIFLSQLWIFLMALQIAGKQLARRQAFEAHGIEVPTAPASPVPEVRAVAGAREREAGSRVCLWYAGLALLIGIPYLALALLTPDWLVGIPSEGTNSRYNDNDFYHAAVIHATALFGTLVLSAVALGITGQLSRLRTWVET